MTIGALSSAPPSLPVALDAMGGDFGCGVVVEGAVEAALSLGISTIIVGRESEIRSRLEALGQAHNSLITVEHADEIVTMEDSAAAVVRGKRESSISKAFELVVSGKACGIVSPGNTGALMAAGLFLSRTLPGIARPAIASLIPRVGDRKPIVLVDSGANVDCRAHQLAQFALMGNCYARSVVACENPRVALLSNGSESSKGNDITRSAAMMLGSMPELNFVGYIEGRDLSRDIVDVVVCDGFVGNIVLKTMEGTAEFVLECIRDYVERTWRGKLGMWLSRPIFKRLFREKLDPSAYGGAPLLGLNHIVIVCHGSANGRAIMNGLRVARKFHDEGLIAKLSAALSTIDIESIGVYEDGMWNRMGQRFEKKRDRRGESGKVGSSEEGGEDSMGGKE